MLKSKYTKYASYSVLFSGIGLFCFIGFLRPGMLREQTNLGHRLGGDVFPNYAENTIGVFRKSVEEIESDPDYLCSECDLRETLDHQIVIFHDWDLRDLVPDNNENRSALQVAEVGGQKISELTLSQIRALRLKDGQQIPTLEEVLETAIELQLKKPLLLEIKSFHSDQGRQAALEIAARYRDQADFEINFSSFRRNFSRSYPNPKDWLSKFKQTGFRVYQVYRPISSEYDLCDTWSWPFQ